MVMTDLSDAPLADAPPDVVDDQTSDVLNENEVVHVPPAVEQLVEAHEARTTYAPDVPHWEPGS